MFLTRKKKIKILKQAIIDFDKTPYLGSHTNSGYCLYFDRKHNLSYRQIRSMLGIVPGIEVKIMTYMFGRNQAQLHVWQHGDDYQKYARKNWAIKALQILEES